MGGSAFRVGPEPVPAFGGATGAEVRDPDESFLWRYCDGVRGSPTPGCGARRLGFSGGCADGAGGGEERFSADEGSCCGGSTLYGLDGPCWGKRAPPDERSEGPVAAAAAGGSGGGAAAGGGGGAAAAAGGSAGAAAAGGGGGAVAAGSGGGAAAAAAAAGGGSGAAAPRSSLPRRGPKGPGAIRFRRASKFLPFSPVATGGDGGSVRLA